MVNEEVRPSRFPDDHIDDKIKRSLAYIFDTHVESSNKVALKKQEGDRISLMQYGKNVKRMFSLVSINQNKTQLRN